MIYKHLLTYDKNFKSEPHYMKIRLFQSEYLKGSDWSYNPNFWSVSVFYWSTSIYLLMTEVSSLRFIIWKLVYFRQNIWRSESGLRRRIFGEFLYFKDLQAFSYLSRKFQVWGSLYENWCISVRTFERVRLVLESEFFVSFCILMISKHLLIYHVNLMSEGHFIKISLF